MWFLQQENKNDLLQIVCSYHALSLPSRGSELIFQPLDHLQPIKYGRPGISALGLGEKYFNIEPGGSSIEVAKVKSIVNDLDIQLFFSHFIIFMKNVFLKTAFFDKVNAELAAAEEALALSIWTTATVCRALSLESVMPSNMIVLTYIVEPESFSHSSVD